MLSLIYGLVSEIEMKNQRLKNKNFQTISSLDNLVKRSKVM